VCAKVRYVDRRSSTFFVPPRMLGDWIGKAFELLDPTVRSIFLVIVGSHRLHFHAASEFN
jgi:hypothetical protein